MVHFKDMVYIQLVVPQVKFESVAIRNPTLLSPNVFATRNGLLLESIAASSSLSLATPLLSSLQTRNQIPNLDFQPKCFVAQTRGKIVISSSSDVLLRP